MGTTKLTRKEILAEDPIHQAIVQTVDLFREQGKKIGIVVGGVVVVALGVYFLLQFLDMREEQAQLMLSKGMDYFHAGIDPAATADPYGKGPSPVFKTEADKLQAADKEFQGVLSKYGLSKTAVVARYYLGLVELRQGKTKEAVQSLEAAGNNSRDRTVAYLAKRVLATHYLDTGNYKGAQAIFESLIRDPKCELPKDDLSVDLSRALVAQGKRDEALKVLREAKERAPSSLLQSEVVQEMTKLQSTSASSGAVRP